MRFESYEIAKCEVKNCKQDMDLIAVMHHHDNPETCKIEREDKQHCITYLCEKHQDALTTKGMKLKPHIHGYEE